MADDGLTQEQRDSFRMGALHSPSMQQQIRQLERNQTISPTFGEAWNLTWDKSEFEPGIGDYLLDRPLSWAMGAPAESFKFPAEYISPEEANTKYPTEEPFTEKVRRGYAESLHKKWRKKEEYENALAQYDGNVFQNFAVGIAGMTAGDFVIGAAAEIGLRAIPGLQFAPASPFLAFMAREAAVAGISGLATGGVRYFAADEIQQQFSFTDVVLEGVYTAGFGGAIAGGGRALGSGMAHGVTKYKSWRQVRDAIDTPAAHVTADPVLHPIMDAVSASNLLEYNKGLLPDIEMKRKAYLDYEAGFDGAAPRVIFESDPNVYYSSTGKTRAEFMQTDFHAARGTIYGSKGVTVIAGREAAEKMASSNYTTAGGMITSYKIDPNTKLLDTNVRLQDAPVLYNYMKEIVAGITDASETELARALPKDSTFQKILDGLDLVYTRDEVLAIKDTFNEVIESNEGYRGYYSGGGTLEAKMFLFDEKKFTALESIDIMPKNDINQVTKTVQQDFAEKYKSHLGEENQLRLKYGDDIIEEADKIHVKTQEQYIADTQMYIKRQEILNESTVANIQRFIDYVSKDRPQEAVKALAAEAKIAHAMNAEDFAALQKQMNIFKEQMRTLDIELKMMDIDILTRIAEDLVFCSI